MHAARGGDGWVKVTPRYDAGLPKRTPTPSPQGGAEGAPSGMREMMEAEEKMMEAGKQKMEAEKKMIEEMKKKQEEAQKAKAMKSMEHPKVIEL